MEIISYSGFGAAKRTQKYNWNRKIVSRSTGNSFRKGTPGIVSSRKQYFSVKDAALTLRGRLLFAWNWCKASSSFLWIVPAAILIAFVPPTVKKVTDYFQSYARPVHMATDGARDYELLDLAMSEMAVLNVSGFDKNGNVLGLDGEALKTKKLFREPVTFSNYTVKSGDTISGISLKFGLSNISTLIALNDISNVRNIKVGQKLRIPSADGMIYKVKTGDTLALIGKKYGVSITDLVDINDLQSEVLAAGQTLFIPGAKMNSRDLQRAMGEVFVNPLKAGYRLSSLFGKRANPFTGAPSNHSGVDMACPKGTPIYASLSGKVAYSGYSSTFGNYVIIQHDDGFQTLYAHMSKIIAVKGQYVTQGTKVGLVGSTGYSTGDHLHFGVYKNGKAIDPFSVLK